MPKQPAFTCGAGRITHESKNPARRIYVQHMLDVSASQCNKNEYPNREMGRNSTMPEEDSGWAETLDPDQRNYRKSFSKSATAWNYHRMKCERNWAWRKSYTAALSPDMNYGRASHLWMSY